MKNNNKDRIAIIGLGKVGTAVGHLLRAAGYEIVAVSEQSDEAARQHLSYTGGQRCPSPAEAASLADVTLITTTDDLIASVCKQISSEGGFRPGCKAIHMSGAGGLDMLASARDQGALVASIHPIQSFSNVDGAIDNIPGSTFGITTSEELRDWSVQFVTDLGGVPFFVSEEDKPLYHAAACIASNYLTTLMHMTEGIYLHFGLSHNEAIRAFWPLVKGTLKNIESQGTIKALTGPIDRGDVGTIEKHVQAFREKLPHLLDPYCLLGTMTVDLALKKKCLPDDRAEKIIKILQGGLGDEHTSKD